MKFQIAYVRLHAFAALLWYDAAMRDKAALTVIGLLALVGAWSILLVWSKPKPADAPAAAQEARALIVPIAGVASDDLVDSWGAPRAGGRKHQGIDIMAPAGTPVMAAAAGRILKLFKSAKGGTTIYQSDPSGRYVLYYAHLQAYAPGLKQGQTVAQGEVIGAVGQTGNATTPHLHFEIQRASASGKWWRGTAVNPYLALKTGRVSAPAVASASR
jgi:murein DD-endopeptidase MepM/ murein hydrolase activator NlpD